MCLFSARSGIVNRQQLTSVSVKSGVSTHLVSFHKQDITAMIQMDWLGTFSAQLTNLKESRLIIKKMQKFCTFCRVLSKMSRKPARCGYVGILKVNSSVKNLNLISYQMLFNCYLVKRSHGYEWTLVRCVTLLSVESTIHVTSQSAKASKELNMIC